MAYAYEVRTGPSGRRSSSGPLVTNDEPGVDGGVKVTCPNGSPKSKPVAPNAFRFSIQGVGPMLGSRREIVLCANTAEAERVMHFIANMLDYKVEKS